MIRIASMTETLKAKLAHARGSTPSRRRAAEERMHWETSHSSSGGGRCRHCGSLGVDVGHRGKNPRDFFALARRVSSPFAHPAGTFTRQNAFAISLFKLVQLLGASDSLFWTHIPCKTFRVGS